MADSIVDSKRFHAHFTSRSTIGQLVGKEHLAFASDETFRMVYNNHALRAMGAIDKQTKLAPTGFCLDSHVGEEASEWDFSATHSEVERLHGASVVPWWSTNDCSDAMFNSMTTVWPSTRQGQCFFTCLSK